MWRVKAVEAILAFDGHKGAKDCMIFLAQFDNLKNAEVENADTAKRPQ